MKILKGFLAFLLLAGMGAALIWGYLERRKELAAEAERDRPIPAPRRVNAENGEVVVKLDKETQEKSFIHTALAKSLSHGQDLSIVGVVLPVQDLIDWRGNYLAARTRLEKARTAVEASRREYERTKTLYDDNRNASAKALQAAETAVRSDQTEVRAAEQALPLMEGSLRQQWGPAVTNWAIQGSPEFLSLMEQTARLIQVTMPPESALGAAPGIIRIRVGDASSVQGRLISPFVRSADPRIQGISYLYSVPAANGVVPGMNVVTVLPRGPASRGVLVPSSAVLWWQGKAWCYVQVAEGRFARRELPATNSVEGGLFVSSGIAPGDTLVVKGAQRLLSEEFRSQIQVVD